jgi:hypothetical protein
MVGGLIRSEQGNSTTFLVRVYLRLGARKFQGERVTSECERELQLAKKILIPVEGIGPGVQDTRLGDGTDKQTTAKSR